MEPEFITMRGKVTFYPLGYLWNGALRAFEVAKTDRTGSNYDRVSAALFCAFAVEAHLNHIGESQWPFWGAIDRLSWKSKLLLIADKLSLKADFGCRPFSTLIELFDFRNHLAHGRNQTDEVSYQYRNDEDDFTNTDPKWLMRYWSDAAIERNLTDVQQVMELFLEKAGFDKGTLALMGDGELSQSE